MRTKKRLLGHPDLAPYLRSRIDGIYATLWTYTKARKELNDDLLWLINTDTISEDAKNAVLSEVGKSYLE